MSAQVHRSPRAPSQAADLFLILQQHGLEHLIDYLVSSGFADLPSIAAGLGSEEAVRSRLSIITNKTDIGKIVALSRWIQHVDTRRAAFPESVGGGENGGEGGTGSIPFRIPTDATANEYCRQATIFREHFRIDRAWPRPGSALRETLELPSTVPPSRPRPSSNSPPRAAESAAPPGEGDDVEGDTLADRIGSADPEILSPRHGGPAVAIKPRAARMYTMLSTQYSTQAALRKTNAERKPWQQVGQRHPDKGGPLDPFPTAHMRSPQHFHQQHEHVLRADGVSNPTDQGTGGTASSPFHSHIVHEHGCQARECSVCRTHARRKWGDGCWQYLMYFPLPTAAAANTADGLGFLPAKGSAIRRVKKNKKTRRGSKNQRKSVNDDPHDDDLNEAADGEEEVSKEEELLVPMWVPFAQAEAMLLETAFRKRSPTILIKGKLANLRRMKWNGRKLRRSHAGAVPFPEDQITKQGFNYSGDNNRKKNRSGEDWDDDKILSPAAIRAAQDAAIQRAIQESFLQLLQAEEERSRALISAEEETMRRALATQYARDMAALFQMLLRRLEAEEEAVRRAIEQEEIKAFDSDIVALLEDLLRQEEIRRLAAEQQAEADRLLEQQKGIIMAHETASRTRIMDEEEEDFALLQRALHHLHAQIALFQRQRQLDAEEARSGGRGKGGHLDDGIRCPYCRDPSCPFFRTPWQNHWQHKGGSLDLKVDPWDAGTLDALVADVADIHLQHVCGGAVKSTRHAASQARARGLDGMWYHPPAHPPPRHESSSRRRPRSCIDSHPHPSHSASDTECAVGEPLMSPRSQHTHPTTPRNENNRDAPIPSQSTPTRRPQSARERRAQADEERRQCPPIRHSLASSVLDPLLVFRPVAMNAPEGTQEASPVPFTPRPPVPATPHHTPQHPRPSSAAPQTTIPPAPPRSEVTIDSKTRMTGHKYAHIRARIDNHWPAAVSTNEDTTTPTRQPSPPVVGGAVSTPSKPSRSPPKVIVVKNAPKSASVLGAAVLSTTTSTHSFTVQGRSETSGREQPTSPAPSPPPKGKSESIRVRRAREAAAKPRAFIPSSPRGESSHHTTNLDGVFSVPPHTLPATDPRPHPPFASLVNAPLVESTVFERKHTRGDTSTGDADSAIAADGAADLEEGEKKEEDADLIVTPMRFGSNRSSSLHSPMVAPPPRLTPSVLCYATQAAMRDKMVKVRRYKRR